MSFFRHVNPNQFPFTIDEKPLLLEKTRRRVDDILAELKTIKDQVASLERNSLEQIEHLKSQLVELKEGFADFGKGFSRWKTREI